jgi:hypothetical protein
MLTENKIRLKVREILTEEEQTVRPGRGGYKKEIQEAGALAGDNPTELMKRLNISRVSDGAEIKKLKQLLDQAVSGTGAMKAVYGSPLPRKDTTSGAEGIRVPVRVIPPRDARKYLEHTLVGAQGARVATFDNDIQIEILGNDILLYFSPRPYSWGRRKGTKKKKNQAPPAGPTGAES